jgi:membrane-bound inhibitor of C-type lysozyme
MQTVPAPSARPATTLLFAAALSAGLLAGCSSVNVWPFGEGAREVSRAPGNATEYRCDGGRRFHVRMLEGGAAWLILPEREVRLEKGAGNRYTAGRLVLEIDGPSATLNDPPTVFSNCKVPAAG